MFEALLVSSMHVYFDIASITLNAASKHDIYFLIPGALQNC
jgi:hypothetical protein